MFTFAWKNNYLTLSGLIIHIMDIKLDSSRLEGSTIWCVPEIEMNMIKIEGSVLSPLADWFFSGWRSLHLVD